MGLIIFIYIFFVILLKVSNAKQFLSELKN